MVSQSLPPPYDTLTLLLKKNNASSLVNLQTAGEKKKKQNAQIHVFHVFFLST